MRVTPRLSHRRQINSRALCAPALARSATSWAPSHCPFASRLTYVLRSNALLHCGALGTAAAIANAIYHATGKRVRDLPITIDKLLRDQINVVPRRPSAADGATTLTRLKSGSARATTRHLLRRLR
jgi:hypothetical protein